MADPFVIVKRSERQQSLGEFALRQAVEFATYLGYIGMYVDTFSSNKAILRIIDKIGGFQKVGVLPVGVTHSWRGHYSVRAL
jgi:RimJ/RimL family protein N-acetyltransferase